MISSKLVSRKFTWSYSRLEEFRLPEGTDRALWVRACFAEIAWLVCGYNVNPMTPLGRTAQLFAKEVGCRSMAAVETVIKEPRAALSRSWIRTHGRLPIKLFTALVERNRGTRLGLR